ncbi:MAG TPA: nucleotidyltransferase family protein [Acidobacteriota bacterium]|nr:nucleotidyltransferase family protein [Acidobacteriota bacterium]
MTRVSRSKVDQILIESLSSDRPVAAELEQSECALLWASARDHCLVPYLHRRWTSSGFIHSLPPATAQRFSMAREMNSERNGRLLRTLGELCSALGESGIPVLISKGLPVSQAYYGDIGLRVLYDLDLLIGAGDKERAFDVLHSVGYRPFGSNLGRNEEQTLLWRPKHYDWTADGIFDPEQPCFVELHTKPWESGWHGFGLRCNLDLWKDHRILEMGGMSIQVPMEEKLLVHLAVHYACNVLESNARLMHLLDIILLLRSRGNDLDWNLILDEIDRNRATPFCFLALDLARRANGCVLPEKVWSDLRRATPRGIVDWLALRGVDDAASMNLHHRELSLIYSLHWHMAAGCSETASVLLYSLRSPWFEGAGPGRWLSLYRRVAQRLQHLPRAYS